jgi:hypothetical protein
VSEASTFRAASPAPVAATPTAEAGTQSVDPSAVHDDHEASLFATYELDQKRPFMADYFEVATIWDEEPSLARDLQEIEGYVREQVTNKKVDNSIKAAKEFIKELERKAGLTRYESAPQRIVKILAYIDFKKVVDS